MEALGMKGGVSIEQLANSVGMLQKNLDSKAGQKALADMGLNFAQIRNLKPEQQWLEIAKSVAATEDPIERMNRGTALFGKQWLTIAPAIQGNIEEVTKAVKLLSTEQAQALDEAGEAWDKFKKDTDITVASYLGNLVLAAKKSQVAMRDLLNPWLLMRKLAQGGEDVAADFLGNMPTLPERATPGLRPIPKGLEVDGEEYLEILERSDKALEPLIEKGLKLKAIQDQLFGRAIIANVNDTITALGSTENITKLTAAASKKLHDDVGAAIEAYRKLGREVPPILTEIYNKTIPIQRFDVKAVAGPSLAGLTKTFVAYGEVAQDGTIYTRDFSNELNAAQIQTDALGNAIKVQLVPSVKSASIEIERATTVTEEMAANVKAAFMSIPDILRDAFIGGGGFLGGLKAIGVQIADALLGPLMSKLAGMAGKFADVILGGVSKKAASGALAGAVPMIKGTAINVGAGTGGAAAAGGAGAFGFGMTAAQAIPVYGAVAAGVFGVVKGIQALKAQAAHKETNRLREAFFDMAGGLETLNPRVQDLTGNVDAVQRVFDARNPEQYQIALNDLNAILEAGKERFAGLQGGIEGAAKGLASLTSITPAIEEALADIFTQTTTEGTANAVNALNDALDEQAKKYGAIEEAIGRYGIKFEEAGKTFQQTKINERAQQLVSDFKLLRGAGVEVNAQMRGMGQSVRDFIKDAKASGAEVPEAMREVIQVAMDAGQVFDENGKNIHDMTQLGLTFGTSMETTMKKVEGAVDRLAGVLEGLARFLGVTLPRKAEEGADGVNEALDGIKNPVIKPRVEWPEGFDVPEFAEGSGGIRDFGSGTPAILHGREAVITEADLRRGLATASAPPVVVHMTINVDGVFSEGDLVKTVQRHIEPIVRQTWEDNVNGSRTNAQDILGVP
jgi:hypothetical protein